MEFYAQAHNIDDGIISNRTKKSPERRISSHRSLSCGVNQQNRTQIFIKFS